MNKRIKYTMPNGGVAVVCPAYNNVGEAITPEQALLRAQLRLPVDAEDVQIIDVSDIPPDRTFRDAWQPDFSVHMPKARDIHRQRMRGARHDKLAALDVEYQRADEKGDAAEKKAIAQRKQELRDVTKHPDIDAAKTPDALKAVWPGCLG